MVSEEWKLDGRLSCDLVRWKSAELVILWSKKHNNYMENNLDKSELDSLEDAATTVESSQPLSEATPQAAATPETVAQKTSGRPLFTRLRVLIMHFNIYLLLFVLIFIIAAIIVLVSVLRNKKENAVTPLTSQTLNEDVLKQLKSTQSTVGDPKQILNVESNAIFAGTVLIRQSLDVAGEIRVNSSLNLPGMTVSGTSTLDHLQASSLTVTGNATIQKALSVSGSGTFGGALSAPSLNINTLQLNGDLQLNRHIDAGGGTPSKSDGTALGGGGTSSVSGTDTAGTVTINTGGNPPAGCFTTVNFAQKFNAIPHVVLTPVGSAAASLNYYVTRTSASFTVCTTNAPPAASSFSFDYIAID